MVCIVMVPKSSSVEPQRRDLGSSSSSVAKSDDFNKVWCVGNSIHSKSSRCKFISWFLNQEYNIPVQVTPSNLKISSQIASQRVTLDGLAPLEVISEEKFSLDSTPLQIQLLEASS